MKLSFDDKESFKEAVGSLCFNNPPSDTNTTLQRIESMPLQDSERDEDFYFNNPSGEPNIFRRVGSRSSSIVEIDR